MMFGFSDNLDKYQPQLLPFLCVSLQYLKKGPKMVQKRDFSDKPKKVILLPDFTLGTAGNLNCQTKMS